MSSGTKSSKKGKRSASPTLPVKGSFVFPSGETYSEYIEKDGCIRRVGKGVHHAADSSVYSGRWKDDKLNGEGEHRHCSGIVYKGQFVNSEYHGSGKMQWPNGCTYTGTFENNRIQGHGDFKDENGKVWVGNFEGNKAIGLVLKLT